MRLGANHSKKPSVNRSRRSLASLHHLVSRSERIHDSFLQRPVSRQLISAVTDTYLYSLRRSFSPNWSTKRVIMPSTRDLVNELIAKDSIVIFSKTYCPYCTMAKKVFDSLKKSYTTIELDDREDAQEIQDVLGEITGARSVPRVFLNGECLGGGTDVKKLHESGELEKKF